MSDYKKNFDKEGFMDYCAYKFDLNEFSKTMIENIVAIGEQFHNVSKDQLVYFITDLVPELEFGEAAGFCAESHLTKNGKQERVLFEEDTKKFVKDREAAEKEL